MPNVGKKNVKLILVSPVVICFSKHTVEYVSLTCPLSDIITRLGHLRQISLISSQETKMSTVLVSVLGQNIVSDTSAFILNPNHILLGGNYQIINSRIFPFAHL